MSNRILLGKYRDQRLKFLARVGKLGEHPLTGDAKILLIDIRLASSPKRVLADHVWLDLTKYLKKCDLRYWDEIIFDASVGHYFKGNCFLVYNLDDIANVTVVPKPKPKETSPLIAILPAKI